MGKQKTKFKNIPRHYLMVGFVSIILNIVLLGTVLVGYVLEETGSFDYATVNSGISRMCSDKFRETVEQNSRNQGDTDEERGRQVALLDYTCSKNGASEYFENGYNEYIMSLGIKP